MRFLLGIALFQYLVNETERYSTLMAASLKADAHAPPPEQKRHRGGSARSAERKLRERLSVGIPMQQSGDVLATVPLHSASPSPPPTAAPTPTHFSVPAVGSAVSAACRRSRRTRFLEPDQPAAEEAEAEAERDASRGRAQPHVGEPAVPAAATAPRRSVRRGSLTPTRPASPLFPPPCASAEAQTEGLTAAKSPSETAGRTLAGRRLSGPKQSSRVAWPSAEEEHDKDKDLDKDEDFSASESEADDEETLEREERLANTEGQGSAQDELDQLHKDGELSVEELLRMYGHMEDEDEEEEEEEDESDDEKHAQAESEAVRVSVSVSVSAPLADAGASRSEVGLDPEGCSPAPAAAVASVPVEAVAGEGEAPKIPHAPRSALPLPLPLPSLSPSLSLSSPPSPSPTPPAEAALAESADEDGDARADAEAEAEAEAEDDAEADAEAEAEAEMDGEGVGCAPVNVVDDGLTEQERVMAAADKARAAQPQGFSFDTVKVKTELPFLLRGSLREYQHIGLDWLVSMYDNGLNGILADEMGLGKTIQTISLLAYLACERGVWGQHLIVVPTSVLVNWEMEFKRWLPSFKILCYYGNSRQRREKRRGWSDPSSFHVCITSYQLILQDRAVFKRKRWHYLILDEAQHIKNFASQRWQVLIAFRTQRRLLLTGTPLQNHLMELWSLMHFLMPQVFQSQKEFKEWFSNPVASMVEGKDSVNQKIISRLHGVLRPFLLRRLKKDVEKQMPQKFEHVVVCRLSKRQRQLYEDFMANAGTQSTLSSGNYLGLMNVLMQLRKVCNHPDLFEGRPIVSPFDQIAPLTLRTGSPAVAGLEVPPLQRVDLAALRLLFAVARGYSWLPDAAPVPSARLVARVVEGRADGEVSNAEGLRRVGDIPLHRRLPPPLRSQTAAPLPAGVSASPGEAEGEGATMMTGEAEAEAEAGEAGSSSTHQTQVIQLVPSARVFALFWQRANAAAGALRLERGQQWAYLNELRFPPSPSPSPSASASPSSRGPRPHSCAVPVPRDLLEAVALRHPVAEVHAIAAQPRNVFRFACALLQAVKLPAQRAEEMSDVLSRFVCIIPKARAPPVELHVSHPDPSQAAWEAQWLSRVHVAVAAPALSDMYRSPWVRTQVYFPDKRLLQWDCGKLQALDRLLRRLKAEGHRVLLFTQMTKMLDILEAFLNVYRYTYLRLDGSTKPEERQRLMERYNSDPRLFAFILSTRSGGVGVNLTGADTVVFYDTDWNPAMDLQAQDRCHRIGQTREVNIYRLVTENTVEENILKKSQQKRHMNNLVIGDGQFTTDFFERLDPKELLGLRAIRGADDFAAQAVRGLQPVTAFPLTRVSRQELELAMAQAEDPSDRIAAQRLADEQAQDLVDMDEQEESKCLLPKLGIEADLTPVEKYALRFAELVDPVITASERHAAEAGLAVQERKWQEEQARKAKAAAPAAQPGLDADGEPHPHQSHPSAAMERERRGAAGVCMDLDVDDDTSSNVFDSLDPSQKNEFAEEETTYTVDVDIDTEFDADQPGAVAPGSRAPGTSVPPPPLNPQAPTASFVMTQVSGAAGPSVLLPMAMGPMGPVVVGAGGGGAGAAAAGSAAFPAPHPHGGGVSAASPNPVNVFESGFRTQVALMERNGIMSVAVVCLFARKRSAVLFYRTWLFRFCSDNCLAFVCAPLLWWV